MRLKTFALLAILFTGLSLRPLTLTAQVPAPVHHVFVVMLENKDYNATFSPTSAAPYLAKTLPSQGALLTNYYSIGHNSLENYQALISGQAPNLVAQPDLPHLSRFRGCCERSHLP